MKDATRALRAKYYQLLNGNILINNVAVPVYYKYVESTVTSNCYILITSISNIDQTNYHAHETSCSIQINVYTKDTIANSGSLCDEIVRQILLLVYPNPQYKLNLAPEFQNTVHRLQNNFSPDALQFDDAIFINRSLNFTDQVYEVLQPVS